MGNRRPLRLTIQPLSLIQNKGLKCNIIVGILFEVWFLSGLHFSGHVKRGQMYIYLVIERLILYLKAGRIKQKWALSSYGWTRP
jgi:hypothetical protein